MPTAVEARSWAHRPRNVSAGWHPRLQPDPSASRGWPKQARPLRVRKCLSVRRVNLMQNCRAMTGGPTHPAAADRSRIGDIAVRFWRGPGASRGRVLCAIRTQPCERAVSRPTRGGQGRGTAASEIVSVTRERAVISGVSRTPAGSDGGCTAASRRAPSPHRSRSQRSECRGPRAPS
jgi:hypothetical protein